MQQRLISLLGAFAIGAGALSLAQDAPTKPGPAEGAEAKPVAVEGSDPAAAAAAEAQAEPLAVARGLVEQLADDSYQARESATKTLWDLGEVGLLALREGVASDDPEVAYRSRVLLRRIVTGITPDTPPEVVALVQRYFRSGPKGKKDVFEKLNEQRAYAQMLRMYHFEEDALSRTAIREYADGAVMPAVLPLLMEERLEEAEKLLSIAPKTANNRRRYAALLRIEGKLDEVLASTEGKIKFELDGTVAAESLDDANLRLSLLRSQGNVVGARELARKMGRVDIVAGLALLEGDPIPYLTWVMERPSESPVVRIHAETVIHRWKGNHEEADKLMRNMARVAREDGEEEREALLSLLLNGYLDLALPLVAAKSSESAFDYYETVEQPLKALAAVGYDGDEAAKKKWLEERMGKVRKGWSEATETREEIRLVASFLHNRGEREAAFEMMRGLSKAAAEEGGETWFKFVGRLPTTGSSDYEMGFALAAERLQKDEKKEESDKVVAALFGEGDTGPRMWKRLASVEEEPAARILLMGSIYGIVHMEDAKLRALLDKLIETAKQEEDKERVQSFTDLLFAAEARDDFGMALAILELLVEEETGQAWERKLASYHSYLAEWEKAAVQIEKVLTKEPNDWHYLALQGGVNIRLGNLEKAAKSLKRVETVVLDEPARLRALAQAVQATGSLEQAEGYWRRLIITSSPRDLYWESSASDLARHARLNKQWRVAAALAEVEAMQYMKSRSTFPNPATYIRRRFAADLFRGLALLEEGDKESALALLGRTFALLNGDASLADDYFPLLREVGLTEEHDRNFDLIYKRLEDSIKAFPKAHNTYNSAAWLASRASRKLDDALAKAETALAMRPRQAAYLDTMAEVWFAKRDREKAVEWSRKAVRESYHGGYSGSDGGVGLREQFERFQSGEFPVP